jgi:hypothetical protein
MYRLSFHAANSHLHHHWLEMPSQIEDLHLRASVAHRLPAVVPHHQAIAELTEERETSIHTGREPVPVRAPQDVTVQDQDQFPPGPDPDLLPDGVVVDEIARVEMAVEGGEAQVIAATAVMTIEAGAAVVDGGEGEDVNIGLSWVWGGR